MFLPLPFEDYHLLLLYILNAWTTDPEVISPATEVTVQTYTLITLLRFNYCCLAFYDLWQDLSTPFIGAYFS